MTVKLAPRIFGRATRERPDKERNPKHRAWIRTFACHLHERNECRGRIECCHVKAGNDATNRSKATDAKTLPLCAGHHDIQTRIGEYRFELEYGLNMNEVADAYAAKSPFLRKSAAPTPASPNATQVNDGE